MTPGWPVASNSKVSESQTGFIGLAPIFFGRLSVPGVVVPK